MKPSLTVRVVALLLLLVFLPGPLFVVIGASLSPDYAMRFPPDGISLRWYRAILEDSAWLQTFGHSVLIGMVVSVLTTLFAICAAFGLHRAPERLRRAVELGILAPLLFPHAAIGIAFLAWLIEFQINGTAYGIVLAHLILCIPFAYRPVSVSLQQFDSSLAEAAAILGANQRQIVRKVVLPMLRPGILTALLFTFIISFDEVTVTIFLVGPLFTTLPVSIYSHLHDSADPIVAAISSILIIMTMILVLVLDKVAGLQFFVDIENDRRVSGT